MAVCPLKLQLINIDLKNVLFKPVPARIAKSGENVSTITNLHRGTRLCKSRMFIKREGRASLNLKNIHGMNINIYTVMKKR